MKRSDISQRVLDRVREQQLEPRRTSAERPHSMLTFIGQVGEEMTQGFAARVEALEKERQDGLVILALDPKVIRPSAQANRHALSLTVRDEDFAALKRSLERDGQILPISVRQTANDPSHQYEIVSGHRRHQAALLIDADRTDGFKIRAVLDSQAADPAQLALHMFLENAARKDLSAYELGTMFRAWIEASIFPDQQAIAAATDLSKASVTKYLQVAALPKVVLEAFGDPRILAVRWAELLVAALKLNEAAVLAAAKKLASREKRPDPDVVLRQLTSAGESKMRRSGTQTETVKINGLTAFAYSLRNEKISIRFGKHVEPDVAQELTVAVKELLTKRLKVRLGKEAAGGE